MKKHPLLLSRLGMAIIAVSLNLAGLNSAGAFTPSQWPECDCPDEFKALLASWDFENLTPGFYPGVPASYVSPWVSVSNLQGPTAQYISAVRTAASGAVLVDFLRMEALARSDSKWSTQPMNWPNFAE